MSRAAATLDDYLTTEEVAEHYGVFNRVVLRHIREGHLPAVKKGWIYLVHKDDLPEEWPPRNHN